MERMEFLNRIKTEMKWVQFDKHTQQKIEQFLLEEIETIHISKRGVKIYTSVFPLIQNQLDADCQEMAKRAFQLFYTLYPETLLSFYENNRERYQIYQEMGLDQKAIFQDIIYNVNRIVKYYGNYFESELKRWISDLQKRKSSQSEWNYLFEGYNKEVEAFVENCKQDAKEEMTQLILTAMCVEHFHSDKEKYRKYLSLLEQRIYCVLKQIYTEGALTEAFTNYFNDHEAETYYINMKKTSIFYDMSILKKVHLILCKFFSNHSKLISDAYKIHLIKIDGIDYFRKFSETEEEVEALYRKFKLPYTFDLRFYSGLTLGLNFHHSGKKYIQKLEYILEQEEKTFQRAYEIEKKSGNLRSSILLAILLKHKKIGIEEVAFAEYCLIKRLNQLAERSQKGTNREFEILYEETPIKNFSLLKEEEFDLKKAKIQCRPYVDTMGMAAIVSVALFEWSKMAQNLAFLFIGCVSEVRSGSNLNTFIKGQQLFSSHTWKAEDLFELLAKKIGVNSIIEIYNRYGESYLEVNGFRTFVQNHKQEASDFLSSLLSKDKDAIIYYVDLLYGEELGFDVEKLVPLLNHKLKGVIDFVETKLMHKKQVRPSVELLLKSKNKNTREAAVRLIRFWDMEKILKEMNEMESAEALSNYIEEKYDEKNIKSLPFADSIDFASVRLKGTEKPASERLLKYYLSEYLLLKEQKTMESCSIIRRFLNQNDMRIFMKNIYQLWLEKGADTKQKNLLLPYALHCNDQDITDLKKQIDTWAEKSRGALAAFAVTAMALNGEKIALMLTDSISNKYKNKQVRSAASQAMQMAADALHITKQQLADRIIPDLGFNAKKEKILDYGSRKFKVILNNRLQLTLSDENGKIIKSLPKANASDHQEMASQCKEELKGLKKQLKTIISTQKNRLETALFTGRKWSREQWSALFVENPIMNCFAIGLIWEERDQENHLLGTFRYMEDGSFNTNEEEEYCFGENTDIMLLHVLDVEAEIIEEWKEQLEDYEIVQPFSQLDLPIYRLMESEKTEQNITRFDGIKVYFGMIRSILEKYDWQRTSVIDGGGYEGYYYEDETSGIGVQMTFDYIYVGMMANEIVAMKKITFYKKGSISYGSYCYDEINSKNRILPKDVPEKLMNFALRSGDLIAQKQIR